MCAKKALQGGFGPLLRECTQQHYLNAAPPYPEQTDLLSPATCVAQKLKLYPNKDERHGAVHFVLNTPWAQAEAHLSHRLLNGQLTR